MRVGILITLFRFEKVNARVWRARKWERAAAKYSSAHFAGAPLLFSALIINDVKRIKSLIINRCVASEFLPLRGVAPRYCVDVRPKRIEGTKALTSAKIFLTK